MEDSDLQDDEKELSEEEQAALEAKRIKLEKEKKELVASLAGGDFSTQKTKVAAVSNSVDNLPFFANKQRQN